MQRFKSIFLLSGIIVLGISFSETKVAQAHPILDRVLPITVSTSTIGTLRRLRIDQHDGKMYIIGSSATTLNVIDADGSVATNIPYDHALPSNSASDLSVSNGTMFITINGAGTYGVYRYDIHENTANLIATSSLGSGSTAITFNHDSSTIYVTKSSNLLPFDTDLIRNAPTTTLVATPNRIAYGGNTLVYLSTSGQLRNLVLDGSGLAVNGVTDILLASGGPTSANAKGLAVSNNGTAFYYANSTTLSKRSTATGSLLWTINTSNIADFDLEQSTGNITVIDTSGVIKTYHPVDPITEASISASGTTAVLHWTSGNSDSDFKGVTIRRSQTEYPLNPTDGEAVTSSNMETDFSDGGLSDGTYYYSFFNETLDGYYGAAVTSTVTINLPPETPILSAEATGATIHLSWSSPADTDAFILRRSTMEFPASYTDGTGVTTTANTVTNLYETSMMDGTFYYSLFARDSYGAYSSAATVAVTVDTTGPTAPTDFVALANGTAINLRWSNPPDSDFADIVIRRSTIDTPTSPTDGVAVTTTVATSYTDASLMDGTYYYSLFAEDMRGNVSTYVTSSAQIRTETTQTNTPSGGGGNGSFIVSPSSIDHAPLRFAITDESSPYPVQAVSSPTILLRLFADPATVRGYAASLDPLFTSANIFPLNPSATIPFILPDVGGAYTVYLKYYSLTGHSSPVLSQTVIYTPTPRPLPQEPIHTSSSSFVFTRTLRKGNNGMDVKALQIFLNTHGFFVANNGQGSPGHETIFFGPATEKAVKKFQESQKAILLKPYNLEKGTGIFGVKTRDLINTLPLKL